MVKSISMPARNMSSRKPRWARNGSQSPLNSSFNTLFPRMTPKTISVTMDGTRRIRLMPGRMRMARETRRRAVCWDAITGRLMPE